MHFCELFSQRKAGIPLSKNESDALRASISEKLCILNSLAKSLFSYEKQSTAIYATARLWDDGVIQPTETRDVLGMALSMPREKKNTPSNFGIFRM